MAIGLIEQRFVVVGCGEQHLVARTRPDMAINVVANLSLGSMITNLLLIITSWPVLRVAWLRDQAASLMGAGSQFVYATFRYPLGASMVININSN